VLCVFCVYGLCGFDMRMRHVRMVCAVVMRVDHACDV